MNIENKSAHDSLIGSNSKTHFSQSLIIFVLFGVQFTHIMDFVVMMPLGPQLMRVFEITPKQFSFIVSCYTFSAAIAGLLGALTIDRFDRKRALCFVYTGFIAGTLLCAIAPTYWLLMGARVIAGAFGGLGGALVYSIIGDVIPPDRRGRAMGAVMSAFSVASVLGVPLGLYLASQVTWHAPFFLLVGVGLAVLTLAIWKLPPMNQHLVGPKHNAIRDLKAILVNPKHLKSFALTIFLIMAGFTVIPLLSPYMVKNAGLKESELPLIYLCGGGATFITTRFFGYLTDIYNKQKVFYWLATLSIIPILTITHISDLSAPVILLITTTFMILISGRFVPAMALITSSTTPYLRGGFMSVNTSLQQMASGVAALVAGSVVSLNSEGRLEHFDRVGFIAATSTVICLFIARGIGKEPPEAIQK